MYTSDNPGTAAGKVSISHWGGVPQARLLASLAAISKDNKGWILIANAPAPLSRQALLNAGVDPARVIDAKKASRQLVEQAMSCPSIAVVVCWKHGDLTPGLPDLNNRQRRMVAAKRWRLSTRSASSYKRLDAHNPGKERYAGTLPSS